MTPASFYRSAHRRILLRPPPLVSALRVGRPPYLHDANAVRYPLSTRTFFSRLNWHSRRALSSSIPGSDSELREAPAPIPCPASRTDCRSGGALLALGVPQGRGTPRASGEQHGRRGDPGREPQPRRHPAVTVGIQWSCLCASWNQIASSGATREGSAALTMWL